MHNVSNMDWSSSDTSLHERICETFQILKELMDAFVAQGVATTRGRPPQKELAKKMELWRSRILKLQKTVAKMDFTTSAQPVETPKKGDGDDGVSRSHNE